MESSGLESVIISSRTDSPAFDMHCSSVTGPLSFSNVLDNTSDLCPFSDPDVGLSVPFGLSTSANEKAGKSTPGRDEMHTKVPSSIFGHQKNVQLVLHGFSPS